MLMIIITIMHDRDYDFKSNRGNHAILRAGVQLYTCAIWHARVPGRLIPSADIE
jgi:hypothetical protein